MVNTFLHSGKLGDIIWALPAIKHLGGGILYLRTGIAKNEIIRLTTTSVKNIFSNTNLQIWGQKKFKEYEDIWSVVTNSHFATENTSLFAEANNSISLKNIYVNHLYKNRNKVAHNTHSYQQNLPTLKTLSNENYKFENYFLWFSVLVLIDEIFIELYKRYLILINESI